MFWIKLNWLQLKWNSSSFFAHASAHTQHFGFVWYSKRHKLTHRERGREIIKNAWKRNACEFCAIESPPEYVEWTKSQFFQAILIKWKYCKQKQMKTESIKWKYYMFEFQAHCWIGYDSMANNNTNSHTHTHTRSRLRSHCII